MKIKQKGLKEGCRFVALPRACDISTTAEFTITNKSEDEEIFITLTPYHVITLKDYKFTIQERYLDSKEK